MTTRERSPAASAPSARTRSCAARVADACAAGCICRATTCRLEHARIGGLLCAPAASVPSSCALSPRMAGNLATPKHRFRSGAARSAATLDRLVLCCTSSATQKLQIGAVDLVAEGASPLKRPPLRPPRARALALRVSQTPARPVAFVERLHAALSMRASVGCYVHRPPLCPRHVHSHHGWQAIWPRLSIDFVLALLEVRPLSTGLCFVARPLQRRSCRLGPSTALRRVPHTRGET